MDIIIASPSSMVVNRNDRRSSLFYFRNIRRGIFVSPEYSVPKRCARARARESLTRCSTKLFDREPFGSKSSFANGAPTARLTAEDIRRENAGEGLDSQSASN